MYCTFYAFRQCMWLTAAVKIAEVNPLFSHSSSRVSQTVGVVTIFWQRRHLHRKKSLNSWQKHDLKKSLNFYAKSDKLDTCFIVGPILTNVGPLSFIIIHFWQFSNIVGCAIEMKIDTWWNARILRGSFSKICWPDFQAQLLKNYTYARTSN